jgi:hypothetical protein
MKGGEERGERKGGKGKGERKGGKRRKGGNSICLCRGFLFISYWFT